MVPGPGRLSRVGLAHREETDCLFGNDYCADLDFLSCQERYL